MGTGSRTEGRTWWPQGNNKAFTHKHEVGHVNIYVAIDYNLDELFMQLSNLT